MVAKWLRNGCFMGTPSRMNGAEWPTTNLGLDQGSATLPADVYGVNI
jgi:hypothetical protein